MPKRAAKDVAEAGAAKRAAPARNVAYLGFRALVLAELDEFGPPSCFLSFSAKAKEVPFYFCLRGRVNGDSVFFVTFVLRRTFETVILSVFCDRVRLLRSFFELQHTVVCMNPFL